MRYRFIKFLFPFLVYLSFISCSDDQGSTIIDPDPDNDIERVLPQITIQTQGRQIVDEPKVSAVMRVVEDGVETYDGPIGIEFRGSTSQSFPKKSYGLETWDENGDDVDVPLLGFPEEEDWILYGPYSDKTLIRNVFVYRLAREMGHYASRTKFVELILDGDYRGVYVFMEQIKRDDVRLDLSDLDPDENDPESITGGYILKIDKTAGEEGGDASYTEELGFRSKYSVYGNELTYPPYGPKQGEETYFLYDDPDPEDISDEQKAYIQSYMEEFEEALVNDLADDGNHRPDTLYSFEEYIDLESFVDFFLLNELAHNADAYRISTFMYKDRGEKLNMGPVWDFNLSLGNDGNEFRRSPETWIFEYNQNLPNDLWLVPFWWTELAENPKFRRLVKQRWNELRAGDWSNDSLLGLVDELTAVLNEDGAVDRNFQKWQGLLDQIVFGNAFVFGSYEGEVDYMRDWLTDRLNWMDQQIGGW